MTFERLEHGKKIILFSGNANKKLAEDIAKCMNVSLGSAEVSKFNNSETSVMLQEPVRGSHVFIIQPTSSPVNDNLMELLIMVDAAKRASAGHITVIVPYYGYARQDRKTRGREPISAKLVANLLTVAGVTRMVTIDLHAGQIQGFFDIPVDHMSAMPILAKYFVEKNLQDVVVVSPDLGGVTRARQLADLLKSEIAIIEKKRPKPGESKVMNLIGEVNGKRAILVDDIIDTAGSLVAGGKALIDLGAKEVYACATHAVFSPPAIENIQKSCLKKVVVTDSIPFQEKSEKVVTVTLAPFIAQAIERIHGEMSMSVLFEEQARLF